MRNRDVLGAAALAATLFLAGCRAEPPQALGTLEWDRIAVPAPAAEPIIAIAVAEGAEVAADAPLLALDPTRTRAALEVAQAQAAQAAQRLDELRVGPRIEAIAAQEARLDAARARATEADATLARVMPLVDRQLLPAGEGDRALAAARAAQADARAAAEALVEALSAAPATSSWRRPNRTCRRRVRTSTSCRPRWTSCRCAPRAPAGSRACPIASATRPRSVPRWSCCWSARRLTPGSTCRRRCGPGWRWATA